MNRTPFGFPNGKALRMLLPSVMLALAFPAWASLGDNVTTVQDWVRDTAAWSGRDARLEIVPVPGSPAGAMADPTRRRSITGPCRTNFPETFRALFTQITGFPTVEPGAR